MKSFANYVTLLFIGVGVSATAAAQDVATTNDGGIPATAAVDVTTGAGEVTGSSAAATGGNTGTSGSDTTDAGGFDALSPGNQKIAEALFNGQTVSAEGSAALSLDQIASAKQMGGWGKIFKQMKADGLTDARNLGDLVSGRYARRTASETQAASTGSGFTVVTTAAGHQKVIRKDPRTIRSSGVSRHGGDKRAFGKSHSGKSHGRSPRRGYGSDHGRNTASLGVSTASRSISSAKLGGHGRSARHGSNKGRQ